MDDAKRVYREVKDKTREVARELDGHQVTDDIGNAGNDVRTDLGNAGDDLRNGADREMDRNTDRRF